MSPQSSVTTCAHIKVAGIRCGSPALRGEQFCYFHQRMIRGVKTPPRSRIHPMALIENEDAIQASLMEVINGLARNTVDMRRAELLVRALNTAVRNARRVRFHVSADEMVRQIPDYRDAPPVERVGTGAVETLPRAESKGPISPAINAPPQSKPPATVKESESPIGDITEHKTFLHTRTPLKTRTQ